MTDSERGTTPSGGMPPEDTAARKDVERFFERCGIDPARCESTWPARTTQLTDESQEVTITSNLSDYGIGPEDWSGLSWTARREACEWLEFYHEVRVEAALLSSEHRRRYEDKLDASERPSPGTYPWFVMELLYQTGEPGWEPQFASLGHRF